LGFRERRTQTIVSWLNYFDYSSSKWSWRSQTLTGLTKIVKEEELSIIVNTADDIELFGLQVSPDVDMVFCTLAGIVDHEKGFGVLRVTRSRV